MSCFNQSLSLQESSVISDPNAKLLVAIFSLHKMDQFDSSEHIDQFDTFTYVQLPVVPINNDTESEVDKLYEAEAKHVMEEDKRLLLFVGDGNEEKRFYSFFRSKS
ncbi:hypothetical protein OPV22_015164 [Ensete ventricosum]|uniref:Uncharacterized protein n=1 Tax=Ensete ventricosum TaxID=4639 RepID=A0AAV8R4Y0_ENSVE|nr:hypothetical protein OPV22_015164 [Ensete ventricosum]